LVSDDFDPDLVLSRSVDEPDLVPDAFDPFSLDLISEAEVPDFSPLLSDDGFELPSPPLVPPLGADSVAEGLLAPPWAPPMLPCAKAPVESAATATPVSNNFIGFIFIEISLCNSARLVNAAHWI
jgi:hypothetical protein